MEPQDPNYRQRLQTIFYTANFINDLGIKIKDFGPGWVETTLDILPKHLQQDTFIHAGVQATMADHTAGGAAATLMKASEVVLTVEFKINLLRPAVGQSLRCKAVVLRAGKTITVAESEVYAFDGKQEKLCAKATVTLAFVSQNSQSS